MARLRVHLAQVANHPRRFSWLRRAEARGSSASRAPRRRPGPAGLAWRGRQAGAAAGRGRPAPHSPRASLKAAGTVRPAPAEPRARRAPPARSLARAPLQTFFICLLIGCYSSEWMVASSLRASANSFGSEEVSRRLGVLWRFFTSQQRSFKRHLLASFTTFHFLFFLPVFLAPNWRGL